MDIVYKKAFCACGINRQELLTQLKAIFIPQKVIRNSRAALGQLLCCSYFYESKGTC